MLPATEKFSPLQVAAPRHAFGAGIGGEPAIGAQHMQLAMRAAGDRARSGADDVGGADAVAHQLEAVAARKAD